VLPKGPKGKWLPTLRVLRNPRATLEDFRDRYGDPFLVNALNGPIVLTGREDLIREIHGTDPSKFLPFATQTLIPILGQGSIFSLVGDDHRRERKLLMPMFHGDRMRAYATNMSDLSIASVEKALPSDRLNILPLMTDISFAVIVQNIIGGTSGDELDRLVLACKKMIASMNPILFFSAKSQFKFLGLSPWDRLLAARERLFEQIDRIIASRRVSNVEHDDILSMLCQARYEDGSPISDEHIRDELITFLFAGHETTALSLTWGMYHLHRNPESLRRLLNEVDSLDDNAASQLASAPFLKGCVQETLRIHPIVTETLRKLKEPIQLGEFTIPEGYAVSPATVLAHYNPTTYPDPESFKPDRFVDRSYSPFVYMPFGGGHRRCIGAAFASYEMAIVLGTLLKHYSFELLDSTPVIAKRRNVTMGPSSDVPMRVQSRKTI
jgi:cytochrome P450 family 110